MSLAERDPNKRRVKPVEQVCVLDFDEESSDDSDFRIEDHPEASDDDDDDSATGKEDASEEQDETSSEDDEEEEEDDLVAFRNSISNQVTSIADVIKQAAKHHKFNLDEKSATEVLICAGCLGDQSDGVNEIVECDGCGVTVHEACYGISDTASLDSTDSLSPTTPWFCEACKAGIKDPVCELCPNKGGVFKETDVGRWVHLVCALYVPGVAFGEVDKLAAVTLFEMPYSKWGAKACSLCDDTRLARTGVCIGCDAGMCRTYFHVTCAQREGFLSEAHSEEVDQADPFYAHCKLHSDTILVKRRRRNYLALSLRQQLRRRQLEEAWRAVAADGMMADGQQVSDELRRVARKLDEQKRHYKERKQLRMPPWVPTQKMPRLLTTSASACCRLLRKAELAGACPSQWEAAEAHVTALADIRRKWHVSPAFSVEFIAYFLDRNDRLRDMRDTAEKLEGENKNLVEEETALRIKYDEVLKRHSDITGKGADLKQTIHKYHSAILSACPNKSLPDVDEIFRKAEVRGKQQASQQTQQLVQMMVPTAAALKMGVGFPLKRQHRPHGMAPARGMLSGQQGINTLMLNECGICRQRRDQHLMAKCDTCHLYYHLSCLNPPLTRLPKKSKLYGWQCSECDKTSDSETEQVKTPRRSRTVRLKSSSSGGGGAMQAEVEPTSAPSSPPMLKIKPMGDVKQDKGTPHRSAHHHLHRHMSPTSKMVTSTEPENQLQVVLNPAILSDGVSSHKSAKKRRREKHRNRLANGDRYSPGSEGFPLKEHKRKRKKKSLDLDEELPHPRITIKIKPIPLPAGEVASESNPQRFYVPQESIEVGAAPAAGPLITGSASRPPRVGRGSMGMRSPPRAGPKAATPKKGGGTGDTCDVCRGGATPNDSVKCDECQKNYHFSCLDPPLKKSPKMRGYSWHCADCDPTGSE